MNEDYLDNLLNSVKDSEAEDKIEELNDNSEISEIVDAASMDELLESVKKAASEELNADVSVPDLDDADKELLGVESLDDIADVTEAEFDEDEIERLKDMENLEVPMSVADEAGKPAETKTAAEPAISPSEAQPASEPLETESVTAELAASQQEAAQHEIKASENEPEKVQEEPTGMDDSISIEDLFGVAGNAAISDAGEAAGINDESAVSDNMIPDEDIISQIDSLSDKEEEAIEDLISLGEDDRDEASSDIKQYVSDKAASDKEASSDKKNNKKKDKSSKGGILALFRKIFFEQVKDDDEPLEDAKDENEQVLQELYGKNTEDGELLSEKNKKKKGPFAKFKAGMKERKEKALEEERLEEEAEELELEEKKRKKEEKKAAAQEKKEAAKAAKEENKAKKNEQKANKPAKPKKDKKPKKEKKPTNPRDILKIKPMSVVMFVILVASFILMITMLNNVLDYTQNISRARGYMQNGNYAAAYRIVHGMELSKSDEAMEEQLRVIMVVERQYESYQNYKQLGMNVEALDALIKGLVQYEDYKQKAEELGVITPMSDTRRIILDTLLAEYKIDEKLANDLVALFNKDFTRYYRSMETYGGAAG